MVVHQALHGEADPPLTPLAADLGENEKPQSVDTATLHVLKDLIEHFDSERRKKDHVAPPFGGLAPRIVEDSRVLWLCPDHRKPYEPRPSSPKPKPAVSPSPDFHRFIYPYPSITSPDFPLRTVRNPKRAC